MTPKERILTAFRGGVPDRVPVSPELWDAIPIRVSGRPFHEFSATSFGKAPLWRAQLEAYRFFGCEAWVPVEPGPSARQARQVETKSRFTDAGTIRTDIVYRAARGTLSAVKLSSADYDLWNQEAPVRDLARDLPLIEECFFEDPGLLDYDPIRAAWEATGDSGICEGIVGNTFFEFLTLHREGGAVQAILDLQDHGEYLREVQRRYVAWAAGVAEELCNRTPVEGLFLNCGSSSLNIVSPGLFREWDLPVVRAVADVARRHEKVFHYHLHGRGRVLLGDLVSAGVTMLCPVECPPKGDFILKEVKHAFAGKLALKGGVDPFVLKDGSDREVEKHILECLADAAGGGGYTLATGDGVLGDTPFERIRKMVDLACRHGAYR